MARIRSIKPEFFTSEDICSLTVRARLAYVGLWCQADREGRLKYARITLAAAIMPTEMDEFDATLQELIDTGHVIQYQADDKNYLYIPTFTEHQRPHNTEADSKIPPVDNGEITVKQPLEQRELPTGIGKGKGIGKGSEEGVGGTPRQTGTNPRALGTNPRATGTNPGRKKATQIPEHFEITPDMQQWARDKLNGTDINAETEKFIDHFTGTGGTKKDWIATWRNWMRRSGDFNHAGKPTTRKNPLDGIEELT